MDDILSKKQWGVFEIGEIFEVTTGNLLPKSLLKKGDIPRISATNNNNGVFGFYEKVNHRNYREIENFISVSFLGSVFYHPYSASLDMKIHSIKVSKKDLNKYLAEFIVLCLKRMVSMFSYGDQLSSSDLPQKKILLPITPQGKPDYDFMEQYMREKEQEKFQKYKNYIAQKIEQLKDFKEVGLLGEKQWGVFEIDEIFEIKNGFYNKKPNASNKGNIPFLGATQNNNGITAFYMSIEIENHSKMGYGKNEPLNKKIFQGNCITVTNNGSVGFAFYQTHEFTCSHDVNPLYLKNHTLNSYLAKFLISVIEMQKVCFEYARKWRPIRMKKSKILLPITPQGKPDYDFMENYIKKIEYNKLIEFINFKNL